MTLPQGAVVADLDGTLIVWDTLANRTQLGLPVSAQTGPLHRSHIVLEKDDARVNYLPAKRCVVDTRSRRVVEHDAHQVGMIGDHLRGMILTTIERARAAVAVERETGLWQSAGRSI